MHHSSLTSTLMKRPFAQVLCPLLTLAFVLSGKMICAQSSEYRGDGSEVCLAIQEHHKVLVSNNMYSPEYKLIYAVAYDNSKDSITISVVKMMSEGSFERLHDPLYIECETDSGIVLIAVGKEELEKSLPSTSFLEINSERRQRIFSRFRSGFGQYFCGVYIFFKGVLIRSNHYWEHEIPSEYYPFSERGDKSWLKLDTIIYND